MAKRSGKSGAMKFFLWSWGAFIVVVVLVIVVVSTGGNGTDSDTMAHEKYQEIEKAWDENRSPLELDESNPEDVVDYMGRTFDNMESDGEDRRLIFEMQDGSALHFVMEPKGSQEGLKLKYIQPMQ